MTGARTFDVGPAPRLDIRIERGTILLLPGEDGAIGLELAGPGAGDVLVDATTGSVTVRTPGRILRTSGPVEVRATVPADARTSLALASGDIDVRATVAELQASAASGDMQISTVTERTTLKTASGDIRIDVLDGQASVTSGSGDVTIGRLTGNGRLTAASGDIEVGVLVGDLTAKTASGDVDVRRFEEGTVVFRTVSGDTSVAIAPGRRVSYDVNAVSGRLRLPQSPPPSHATEDGPKPRVRIEGRSVSGDTILEHAPAER